MWEHLHSVEWRHDHQLAVKSWNYFMLNFRIIEPFWSSYRSSAVLKIYTHWLDYVKVQITNLHFRACLRISKLNRRICGRISTIHVTKNRTRNEKSKTSQERIETLFFQPIINPYFCAENNRNRKAIVFCPIEKRQGLNSIRFLESLNTLRKV